MYSKKQCISDRYRKLRSYCPAHAAVTHLKRVYRNALKSDGYSQLSINTFMKNDEVIILKSMVEDTNPKELDFLSTTQPVINAIENKRVHIQAFVRQGFHDMDIRIFKMAVEITKDTKEEYPFGTNNRTNINSSYRYPVSYLAMVCNNVIPAAYSKVA